jgi:hypothetical protein
MRQVDGFDFPVGAPDGDGYYVAAGLGETPYYERFGAWHTGEDWNTLRPPLGDADLGDAVYAVAHGRVTTADYFIPSWGNIVLIEHELGETRLWSQYAHCQEMLVSADDEVERGQKIATIGKGAGDRYPAHLHFEIRRRDLQPTAWGWTREQVLLYYLHPTEFIRANRPGADPRTVTVDDGGAGFVRYGTDFWHDSDIGYGGHALWTWTVDGMQGEECVAEWVPVLSQGGYYEIMVYVPRQNATTRQAHYWVTHRRGRTMITVDQSNYYDEWVSLGRFALSTAQPASVRLGDMTGETYHRDASKRKAIAFDAVRFVLLD